MVVSAGAAETPRLLLWSGLGNDQVGRHLQSHTYALAYAKHRDRFHAWTGPGHSWATLDFNHHNPGVVGGGVIHDGTQNLPVAAAGMLANFFSSKLRLRASAWRITDSLHNRTKSSNSGVSAGDCIFKHSFSPCSVSRWLC